MKIIISILLIVCLISMIVQCNGEFDKYISDFSLVVLDQESTAMTDEEFDKYIVVFDNGWLNSMSSGPDTLTMKQFTRSVDDIVNEQGAKP